MLLQVNNNGSNNGRRHLHQDDDDGNGKDKPLAPLTQINNSPPAPPPTLQQTLCRRRRRSDLLLFLIGSSTCLLSALHIVWHSDSLPHHSRHPMKSSSSSSKSHPQLKLKGKSALQLKLDEFVNAKATSARRASYLANTDIQNHIRMQSNKRKQNNATAITKKQNNDNNIQPKKIGDQKVPLSKKEAHITHVDNKNATAGVQHHNHNNMISNKQKQNNDTMTAKKKQSDDAIQPKTYEQQKPLLPPPTKEQDEQQQQQQPHPVAHLNCADHGGPTNNQQIIDEMVFWSDIPSDSSYLSPMHPLNDPHTPDDTERFLTFEPDSGGWNNIRMAMETALVMSHAMGRTLVLPPEQRMYLIDKSVGEQQSAFSFNDFFHLDAISIEHRGFKVITMEEFLVRVGRAGELRDFHSHEITFPPGNVTNYVTGRKHDFLRLWKYLRSVGNTPEWDSWECALAIPSSTDPQSIVDLNTVLSSIMDGSYGKPRPKLEEFNGKPTPVNASLAERMREMLADRPNLCIYDKSLQKSKLIHLKVDKGVRYLTHFYAFIFFADWKQDLWSKRFVRDHLRYVDEIMCAAARVVEAVRDHARNNKHHNASHDEGIYDAMHVRRGDFQFPPTQLPADKLHELSKGELAEGGTLYIATDERNKSFFEVFTKHYDVVFLDDFLHVIPELNTNYYGMIDQLVAYKSRVFFGTWWSTLSGYVNRMRGYYIAKHKLEGYKDGTMKSWYFTPQERMLQMRSYIPVRKPIYCREFPVSWRDIDQGIEGIH